MSLANFLASNPAVFITFMAILGLIMGSFLNVVIYRLPVMMEREWKIQCQTLFGNSSIDEQTSHEPFNLVKPRSRCPHCHQLVTALSNIPVISYLVLKGRCKSCKHPISPRYPLVELLSGIMTAIVALYFGFHIQTLFVVILTWALICLSFIDIDHQLLPDDIIYPVLWLGLIANMFGLITDIHSSLLGAIFGYLVLWTVFMLFKLATGKEGMGYGDFKLLSLLGAWLGWQQLPLVILMSSVMGALVGVSLIVFSRHGRDVPIPFGPYLAIAGWIALIWGTDITTSYLAIYR